MSAFYLSKYENVRAIDASRSKWSMKSEAEAKITLAAKRAMRHAQALQVGQAGPILDVLLAEAELQARQGAMKNYCPVRWASKRELMPQRGFPARKYGAEYRGRFYHCAGQQELDLFVADPTRYLYRQRLPPYLPRRNALGEEVGDIAMGGYCPVSMFEVRAATHGNAFSVSAQHTHFRIVPYYSVRQQQTPGWDGFVQGKESLLVHYAKNVFSFASERALQKFMLTPDKYATQHLPPKLPPRGSRLDASVR